MGMPPPPMQGLQIRRHAPALKMLHWKKVPAAYLWLLLRLRRLKALFQASASADLRLYLRLSAYLWLPLRLRRLKALFKAFYTRMLKEPYTKRALIGAGHEDPALYLG